MNQRDITLCVPDGKKSCFACCPPIRPAGYEHIQFRKSIERVLRENSEGFSKDEERITPITGFSCWALGYLDREHKLIGCLLHPGQNGGVDRRYRVDYGGKCRREICQEEKTFSELKCDEKKFWLHLADDLDSFSYSSRKINPLFPLMGWGTYLLSLIACVEGKRRFTRESFFEYYPFFQTEILPRAHSYLIRRLVVRENVKKLKDGSFGSEFQNFVGRISRRLNQELPGGSDGPHVHLLDIDRDFSDFLRLSTGMKRVKMEDAVRLKEITDEELHLFQRTI
jgi:hypothetical protein